MLCELLLWLSELLLLLMSELLLLGELLLGELLQWLQVA